jgi:predicted PurR-regulated permease PerM
VPNPGRGSAAVKINFNKQYTTMAVYALLVILCGILCVFTFTHFGEVWAKVIDFLNIFMPIFYGMAIAYLVYPTVKFFERKVFRRLYQKKRYGLARILSIVIVFFIAIVFIVLFCWLILPHIIEGYVDLQQKSSMYIIDLQEWLFDVAASSGELSGYVTKLFEYFISMMEGLYEYVINMLPDISGAASVLLNFVTNFFLGIVLSIYFLLAKEKLHAQMKKFLRAFLNTKRYRLLSQSARLADKNFGGYIKGQIADSLIMGVVSYFCLMLIGVPFFPLISTIVGIASLIPVIGSLLGTIIGALIIFLANPPAVIWFVLFMIVLCQINARMIRPYMIRVGVDASTMFMFAAIIIMTGLIGFWGLVIGVPVFVIFYTILHFEVDKRLQLKGLPVDQSDYYETDAGKELYREREYKRLRRARGAKKEDPSDEKEDFVVVKSEAPAQEETVSSEDVQTTEEVVSE